MKVIALLALLALGQEKRIPPPDAAAQKDSEVLIRDLFKEDFAKTAVSDRAALGRKLYQQALDSRSDPASCYVLLAHAEGCAVQAGDAELLGKVLDELGKAYIVDVLARKEAALQKLPSRTAEDAKRASAAWIKLSSDLLAAGEFDRAEKAALNAAAQGRKAKEIQSVSRADALSKDIRDLKGKYRGLATARLKLSTQIDDPESNLLVGRFDCLVNGDWQEGLPKLAKGSDQLLKAAAEAELGAPADTTRVTAIGDQWYGLAEKETGISRLAILRHAGTHYRSASSSLTGLSKIKVEKRLEEIVRLTGSSDEVNLIALIDPKVDNALGEWLVKGTTLVSQKVDILEIPYTPPDAYDLRVTVERKTGTENFLVGILVEGRQVAILVDESGDLAGLSRIDGNKPDQNPTGYRGKLLLPDKERVLIVTVRKGAVALTVDGQRIFDWKGEASRLSRNPATPVRRSDVMYLVAHESQFVVKQMILTPISVPGKNTR